MVLLTDIFGALTGVVAIDTCNYLYVEEYITSIFLYVEMCFVLK